LTTTKPDRNNSRLIWILGILSAFSAFGLDMLLPSLPAIGDELSASAASIQLTLSVFFIGFSIGQLIYGPLSDHFGRKPILLAGILLYTLTAILSALTDTIETLVILRFLQALGGGAVIVVARATVRDKFTSVAGARVMSSIMMITALVPLLAPIVGGYVFTWMGWRAVFWLMGVISILSLAATLSWVPETNNNRGRDSGKLIEAFHGYKIVLANIYSIRCILSGGFAFAGLFGFLAASPFVYIEYYGIAPQHYGFVFAINVFGVMVGSWINRSQVTRYGPETMMRLGTYVHAGAGIIMLLLLLAGLVNLGVIVVLGVFFLAPLHLIAANALTRSTESFPRQAGAVTALFGTAQYGLGGIAALAVGQLHNGTPFAMGVVVCACGILCLLANPASK
jgi:DHA1 family bicyclomycin/chloramphenicol resistance-like MFS transporter